MGIINIVVDHSLGEVETSAAAIHVGPSSLMPLWYILQLILLLIDDLYIAIIVVVVIIIRLWTE